MNELSHEKIKRKNYKKVDHLWSHGEK